MERISVNTRALGPILLGLICCFHAGRAAWAETVIVTEVEGRGTAKITGQIVEYSGEQLSLRLANGRVEVIDPARLVTLADTGNPIFEQARQTIAAKKWNEALELLQQALRDEKRAWAQREIVAASMRCYRNLQQIERANQAFLALCRSDPKTVHFADIPLSWGAAGDNPQWLDQARRQLNDPTPVGRLIAASWLLSTNDQAAAIRVLQALLSETDSRVVFLTEAQLWRTRILQPQPTDLARWQERVAAMPESLRAGPYLILGNGLARSGQSQAAITAWMHLPILYPQHRQWAAEALLAAAGELAKINQPESARGLYRELLLEHADSPLAAQAERRLKELAPTNNEPTR